MKLTKGDIVTFLSKEEREAREGTRSDGTPRSSYIIDKSGAFAGIIETANFYENRCETIYLSNRLPYAWKSWFAPTECIASVVGHIDDINYSDLEYNRQYQKQVSEEVFSRLSSEFSQEKTLEPRKISDYSIDVLKVACDIIDEFGDKCITSSADNDNKYDSSPSFHYPANICFKDYHEETISNHTRSILDNIKAKDALDIMERLRFKFGRNRLYAGEAVICILNMLEARYGLDFNKLEDEVQKKGS